MKLTEIEERCKGIDENKRQLERYLGELRQLETKAKERSKEIQMLREIAKIRGEEPPSESKLDELENTREKTEIIRRDIEKLEKEILEGMKDISLPIPNEIPKVDSAGNSTIIFEGGPYNSAIKFMAETMNSNIPLELDKTQLCTDKIVMVDVKDRSIAIDRLKILRGNLGRLARVALREQDPDVEEVVEYLAKSDYRELWETIRGRKRVSYEDVFLELGAPDEKDKKRVRNFFTNLQNTLNEKFPFLRIDSGSYELSFFGSLVWRRYIDKYPRAATTPQRTPNEAVTKKEDTNYEATKTSVPSLNSYLSDEKNREIIYGKEDR